MVNDSARGPLAGIRVIDLSRLAPGPYGSMLLADLGAEVIAITGGRAGQVPADFARGKRFVHLNLKHPASRQALHRLVATADVLIEGFRPGVADRLGAGYAELSQVNPRLVYCSVTGYDPDGPGAQAAGHDINYLAVTGLLGSMGPAGGPPAPPLNVVADLAGGGLLAAFGICAALVERDRSGHGQRITAAMTDGVLSMMEMWLNAWRTPLLPERGLGFTTGAAPFYRCYRVRRRAVRGGGRGRGRVLRGPVGGAGTAAALPGPPVRPGHLARPGPGHRGPLRHREPG